jgi:phage/plasmid-associated DNA primase
LKKFVNLIGNGDNGKSVFIELHQEIFNGFSTQGNKRTFISQKNQSNHDAEIMSLINSRFVSLTELKKKEAFNEELIKAISGGDTQNVRGCGQKDTIKVLFSCVLWIATNELAKFENEQFKNRLLCVDFGNKFEKNPKYVEELKEMYDDFFTHLCLSAKQYYENGRSITFCQEIDDYTNQMKDSQNSFLNWLASQDIFEQNEDGDEIDRDLIREHYYQFCRDNEVAKTANFYIEFEKHFNVKPSRKSNGGFRYYKTFCRI